MIRLAVERAGFTLIELLVTLTVVLLTLNLGVPAMRHLIEDQRRVTQTNNLLAALSLARSEAVKRGRQVVLCKSRDQLVCAADDGYEQGWILYEDRDQDAVLDAGETLLRVQGAAGGGVRIQGSAPIDQLIAYTSSGFTARQPDGRFQSGSLTFSPCASNGQQTLIVIKETGRAGVEKVPCAE